MAIKYDLMSDDDDDNNGNGEKKLMSESERKLK